MTIFVSTAYLDEAERCNRLALIHNGRLLAVGTPAEIKRLANGTIIEVQTNDARKAKNLLKEILKDTSVGLFGDRLHLMTNEPGRIQKLAETCLAAVGISVTAVRIVDPSLEDVFVSVMARGSGDKQDE